MKLPGEDEAVKSFDLTQYKTNNINSIDRLVCKKQKNIIIMSGFIRVAAINADTNTMLLSNLPEELTPKELQEGVALSNYTTEVYRTYINTDRTLNISSPVVIPEGRRIFFNISYFI